MANERTTAQNQTYYTPLSPLDEEFDTGVRSAQNPFLDRNALNEHRNSVSTNSSDHELSDLSDSRSHGLQKEQDASSNALDRTLPTSYTLPAFSTKILKSTRTATRSFISFGWWGELVSLSLSVLFALTIVHMLRTINNKPLSSWKYMEPNSLAAVFSTLLKALLLYPVTEGLGQLKWVHFGKPRRLNLIQALDDASRGPWGAVTLLWKAKGTALLASFGALVTIAILAFDPFTQRSIRLSTRLFVLRNETGSLIKTQSWLDAASVKSILQNDTTETVAVQGWALYPMSQSMLAIMSDRPFELNNAKCPTLNCKAPSYDSLAVCSTCDTQPITRESFHSCTYQLIDKEKPEDFTKINDLRTRLKQISSPNITIAGRCEMTIEKSPDLSAYGADANLTIDWRLTNGVIQIGHAESAPDGGKALGQAIYLSWATQSRPLQTCNRITNWGTQHGQAPFDREGGNYSSTSIQTYHCFNSTTDFMLWSDISQIGEINGTATSCRLNFCAQQHTDVQISNNQLTSTIINKKLKRRSVDKTVSKYTIEDDPSREYLIDQDARSWLIKATRHVWEVNLKNPLIMSGSEGQTPGNWTHRFNRLASTLSTVIQGPTNPSATNFTIDVYGDDIYVEVRWGWMILPLATTALGVLFFVATVLMSARKPYLFKTSVLALLFHGLEGWDAGESGEVDGHVDGDGARVTTSILEDRAKKITATFRRNEGGFLKLKTE